MERRVSISAMVCAYVTVALLAGCAGNGASQLAPTTGGANPVAQRGSHRVDLYQTLVTPRNVTPNFSHRVKDAQIVKPDCCALQKTLFASDAFGGSNVTGAIYMFDYTTGAFFGQVAPPPEGFLEVQGGCSDSNSGNVYFANTMLSTIDEYNHSGTYVATMNDPGQNPVGCAYDETTGNLAVSNITSSSGGSGSLSIYNGGVLQHTYAVPNMSRVYFLGYEAKTGVLWLDGQNSSGIFQYDSFSRGAFTPVTISGATILLPGMVQWSGRTRYMNVGDQELLSAATVYQVDDAGNVKGETVMPCALSIPCNMVQGTIKGPGLVVPDSSYADVSRFAYPAGGGYPIFRYLPPNGFALPIGSAVSPNK